MAAPNLRTDLSIVQLPATLPNVGGLYGKNTIVSDPDFGTEIVRATDASCGNGLNFDSMQTSDDPSGYAVWNTDDTLYLTRSTGGSAFLNQFVPATMQSTQLGGPNPSFPYKLTGANTPSHASNGIIYNCAANSTVVNALTYSVVGGVWTYQSTTEVCDFANILPGGAGFDVTWQSELEVSSGDTVFTLAFSNAGGQNTGIYVCLYKVGSGYRMLNTNTLAITGGWGATGTATMVNTPQASFLIHGVNQPANALYTNIGPKTLDDTFIWANTTLTITSTGQGGHHGIGILNLYTGNPGGGQYEYIPFSNPVSHTHIIPVQAGPPGLPANQSPPQTYTGDQHSAMGPLQASDQTLLWITNGLPITEPFTSCWMWEIRGIDVTGAISGQQGIVYRLCHTFNSGKSPNYIVAYSLASPSQTGNFIAFPSDWGGNGTVGPLGSTSGAPTGTIGGDARGDVFIVRVPYTQAAPVIVSANNTTFTENVLGSFTVNTTGLPIPAISESGSLPSGVTFTDNGNGTATLSGTPTASGTFAITISATNSLGTANQPFTLTVSPNAPPLAPQIVSANSVSFTDEVLNSFSVETTGTPTPSIVRTGTLPAGVTFVDNGNGTGLLSGTPSVLGIYPLTFTAANGVSPNAVQPFNLSVGPPSPNGVCTGTFQYPTGTPVANGPWQFSLTAAGLNVSVACTVPTLIGGRLDANGNLSTSFVFNDRLETVLGYKTNYQLTVKDLTGRQVWNETYYFTGTAANLTTYPPAGH
jgi:hypothetical protein